MIRFLFRLLAMVALSVAVILAVIDATRTVAASALVLTPLGESWSAALPRSLAAVESALRATLGAAAWDPAMVTVLSLPGFLVMLAIALLFHLLGGHRRPSREAAARRG